MHELTGGCHCCNIKVVYRTMIAPEDSVPRACQCSFCRKQNTRAVSDPKGTLAITVGNESRLSRYRFGLAIADYLVCRECGIYVAAFMTDADRSHGFATLMANALDAHARYPAALPIDYDGEDEAARSGRRRQRWTPATLKTGS